MTSLLRTRHRLRLRAPRTRVAILWLAVALSLAIACAAKVLPPDGQLMVVLNTDMAPPKDFNLVHVEAKRQGSTATFYSRDFYFFGTNPTKVPSTVNFVGGSDRTPIEIRIEARKEEKVRVVREMRVVVPTERVAQLDVGLSYLCDAKTCDAGKTCIFGSCEDVNVDADKLPDYDRRTVFGGGSGTGDGVCFNVLECFSKGASVPVDAANDACSIEKPSETGGLNVAVLLPAGTDGICASNACLIPLDHHPGGLAGPLLGWREDGARITLPREICNRKLHVVTTTACAPKTPGMATCGPWSSVGSSKPLEGTTLPFDPDASAPCVDNTRDCSPTAGNNRTPRLCVKGVFQDQPPCADACNAGVCADCTDGTTSCGSAPADAGADAGAATIPRRCAFGAWNPLTPCPADQACGSGVCADREWTVWPMPATGTAPDGGTPRLADANYVVDGQIVTDKTTGLQWLQSISTSLLDEPLAISFCATRDVRGGGWRLPTAIELISILDYGATGPPYINTNVFPGVVNSAVFRSATVRPGPLGYRFEVGFGNGNVVVNRAETATSYARCVR